MVTITKEQANQIIKTVTRFDGDYETLLQNYKDNKNPCTFERTNIDDPMNKIKMFYENQNRIYQHLYDSKMGESEYIYFLACTNILSELNNELIDIIEKCLNGEGLDDQDIEHYNYNLLLKYLSIEEIHDYLEPLKLSKHAPENPLVSDKMYKSDTDLYNAQIKNYKNEIMKRVHEKAEGIIAGTIVNASPSVLTKTVFSGFTPGDDKEGNYPLNLENKDVLDDVIRALDMEDEEKNTEMNIDVDDVTDMGFNQKELEKEGFDKGGKRRRQKMKTRKALRKSKRGKKHLSSRKMKSKRRRTSVRRR
jgi:hypothetical protein